jgi:RimJ/RimL family protein N-acetyltransferase
METESERVPLTEQRATAVGPVLLPPDELEVVVLEHIATRCWPAVTIESLGQWRLRAADGFTDRANSAMAVGDPGVALPTAIAATADFYRSHGLIPKIDIPLPHGAAIERHVAAAGWRLKATLAMHIIDVADLAHATPAWEFSLAPEPSYQALAVIEARLGRISEAAMPVLTNPIDRVVFAEGYAASGALEVMARGSLVAGWLGIHIVETVPAARRRGLGGAVLGALARWAHAHATRRAFLQVDTSNVAALALYDRLGFIPHHTYRRYQLATDG